MRRLLVLAVLVLAAGGFAVFQSTRSTEQFGNLQREATIEEGDDNQFLKLMLNPDATLLAVQVNGTGARADSLDIYAVQDGSLVSSFILDHEDITFYDKFMLGFTGSHFAMRGVLPDEQSALVYVDTQTGDITETISLPEDVLAAAEAYYLTANDRTVTLYQRDGGTVLWTWEAPHRVNLARFTADGQHLVFAHDAGSTPGAPGFAVHRVDLPNGQPGEPLVTVEPLSTGQEANTWLSPNGRYLAIGVVNGQGIHVLDLDGKRLSYSATSEMVGERITEGVIFVDEKTMVFGTSDGILHVLNLETGTTSTYTGLAALTGRESLTRVAGIGDVIVVLSRDLFFLKH